MEEIKPKPDKYWDEEDQVDAGEARITSPLDEDVQDELHQLDSFREFEKDLRQDWY